MTAHHSGFQSIIIPAAPSTALHGVTSCNCPTEMLLHASIWRQKQVKDSKPHDRSDLTWCWLQPVAAHFGVAELFPPACSATSAPSLYQTDLVLALLQYISSMFQDTTWSNGHIRVSADSGKKFPTNTSVSTGREAKKLGGTRKVQRDFLSVHGWI